MSAFSIRALSAHRTWRRPGGAAALLLALALALPPGAVAGPPTIADLGTLPGGTMSLAGGMNAHGQVVGAGDTDGAIGFRAFLWDPAAGMQSLGSLGGDSYGHGISAATQVVGSSRNAQRRLRAFLWEAAAGMLELGTLPGGTSSAAHAINGATEIVGESNLGGGFLFHAFRWTAAGGMQDLGTLPGGSYSLAYAINDAGQVVGEADAPDPVTADLMPRAFLWDAAGGMRSLGTLPGGRFSVARGINAGGQVVGWSETAGGAIHAFLWDPVAGMTDLGTLGAGTESRAFGVNDAGQVVGGGTLADGFTGHAFVWDRASGMQDLGTLPGGSWSEAYAINDAGQVMGQATTATGEDHVVRWQLNRPPAAASQAVSTVAETPVAFSLAGLDPDGDTLAFIVVSPPAHGTLTGTPPDLTYTPAPGYTGGDAFTFAVSDGLATSAPATVSITVARPASAPLVPGRMQGHGYLEADGLRHHFEFHARVNDAGEPSGRLRYHVQGRRHGGEEEGAPAAAGLRGGRFAAGAITAATFSDDPALSPGRRTRPLADAVVLGGTGSWNGAPGYRFEARATDAGEPGRGRDTFAVTIIAPDGTIVAAVTGTLAGGNIQSRRPGP